MAIVTDVHWTCPGCGSAETAQVLGEYADPDNFTSDAVPTDRGGLRWNPPCQRCGQFRLEMPRTIACTAQRIPVTSQEVHED